MKTGVAGAAAVALTISLATPANADPQAQASDVVIVGSDTAQFLASFVDDGMSAIPGTTGLTAGNGYNKTNKNRIFSYDATADALGRTVTMSSGANPGVVLRAGAAPTHLPNGSGDGYTVFEADTSGAKQIDFVRGSRMPNAGDISAMTTAGDSYHTWKIASDGMQIAVSNAGSNAPAAGIAKADLTNIYKATPTTTTWTQLGGTSTDLIVPLLPQDGSGTHDDFLNDILGSKTTPANSHLVRTQEHDPSPLTDAGFGTAILAAGGTDMHSTDGGHEQYSWQGGTVTVADAITPFSTGRYNLIQKGYFDVNRTAVGDPAWVDAIKLLPATGSGYNFARFLYLSARQSDLESTTGWQAGSATNKITAVVNQYKSSLISSLFADAGVTQSFHDCGTNAATC